MQWQIAEGLDAAHHQFVAGPDLLDEMSESALFRLGRGISSCLALLTQVLEDGIAAGAFTVEDPVLLANTLYASGLGALQLARVGILVVAIDDQESAVNIVKEVREAYPSIKIFARAFDRVHGYKLYNAGADQAIIETGWSAVYLGADVSIEGSVVGPYASLSDGARVSNSVVRDSIVGAKAQIDNAVVTGSVIGDRARVRAGFRTLNVGDDSAINFDTAGEIDETFR